MASCEKNSDPHNDFRRIKWTLAFANPVCALLASPLAGHQLSDGARLVFAALAAGGSGLWSYLTPPSRETEQVKESDQPVMGFRERS